MKNGTAVLAGLMAVVIWAAIPALVKLGSGPGDFLQMLVLRFSMALVFFIPVLSVLWRKARALPPRRLASLGCILAANYYFQTIAMQRLPASWYIVIFSLNPLLALVALRVRLSRKLATAAVVSALGTLLFVQSADLSALLSPWTLLSLVIGMLTWVLYTLLISSPFSGLCWVWSSSRSSSVLCSFARQPPSSLAPAE